MSTQEELLYLPMTELEHHLKNYITTHVEWKGHILTSSELSAFLSEFFTAKADILPTLSINSYLPKDVFSPAMTNALLSVADQETDDFRSCQQEKTFIPQKFDISVGRMTRYMPAHWHTNDYFELYYVFNGKCELHFENEVLQMKPGTICLLSPTTYHASPCYSDDCILFYYMIRTSTFNLVFWNNLTEQNLISTFFRKVLSGEGGKSYLHFETENDEKIRLLLIEICQEYISGNHYSPQLMNSLMSVFFIQLLRGYENKVHLPSDVPLNWNAGFGEIFTYIQNNYRTVTLQELSKRFNYSERQLTRILQYCTNHSFSEVLLGLRMHNAAGYLTGTSLSAEKIAELVGYSNSSSFYRAFSKFYKCSPSEYRRMRESISEEKRHE